MSLMDVMWFGLVFAVAIALFVLKYEVQGLEDDLAKRQSEIEKHTKAIHVLEAEWTFLNDPARLRRLGIDHLELAPVPPSRIVTIDALPLRAAKEKRPAPANQAPIGAAP